MMNSRCGLISPQVSDCRADAAARAASATAARAASVHADGLKLVAPCVGDRSFAAVGQHDGGAVGGMQREQFQPWRDFRRLRNQSRHVLGTDLFHVGDMAFTKMGQCLDGNRYWW